MDERSATSQGLVANGELLLQTGRFSNLTLVCQHYLFHVHRAIVCARVPVWNLALGGHFKESEDRKIEINVVDRATLQRALAYLYTGEYDDATLPDIWYQPPNCRHEAWPKAEDHAGSGQMNDSDEEELESAASNAKLQVNARVYIFADYYQILDLEHLASEKFKSALKDFKIEGFSNVCRLVHDFTPPTAIALRSSLTGAIRKHARRLILDKAFMSDAVLFPELLRDAFEAVVRQEQITSDALDVAIAVSSKAEETATRAEGALKEANRRAGEEVKKVNNAACQCRYCGLEKNVHFE